MQNPIVNQIFFSVQGEGKNSGSPSIFVRFSGCNFICPWCDTKYAQKGKEMTVDDICKIIQNLQCKNIVFTGGEPFLQQDAILEIIKKLNRVSELYYYEVETNGTLDVKEKLCELLDLITVSPKITVENYVYNNFYSELSKNCPELEVVFKFVVDNYGEMEQTLNFINKEKINENIIYLMPKATSITEQFTRLPKITKFVIRNHLSNLRVTSRLQYLSDLDQTEREDGKC